MLTVIVYSNVTGFIAVYVLKKHRLQYVFSVSLICGHIPGRQFLMPKDGGVVNMEAD